MSNIATQCTHQGQIIAHYRKRKHWSQQDLAEALRVDVRTVQRMEQQQMMKSLSRRQLLVGLLGIPTALLALEQSQALTIMPSFTLNDDRMTFFEDEMAARWELYHTGGTLRAARGLDMWIKEITSFAQSSQGTSWHHRSLTLLTMSYQLQTCVSRDLMDFKQAHVAARRAYRIAQELNDAELIASALTHEGIALVQQDKQTEAIRYLNGAYKTIHSASLPNLKGYILQALSEAYAKDQRPQECWHTIGLLERTLERQEANQAPGKTRFYASSIHAQKGVNAVLLQDYSRAIALIDKSLTKYNPTFIRGRSRLLSQKAEAYYGLGSIDECAATAEEALLLAQSVGSNKTMARVTALHTSLLQSPWRKERSIARLGALLSL